MKIRKSTYLLKSTCTIKNVRGIKWSKITVCKKKQNSKIAVLKPI